VNRGIVAAAILLLLLGVRFLHIAIVYESVEIFARSASAADK
jgi:hypothetical protein